MGFTRRSCTHEKNADECPRSLEKSAVHQNMAEDETTALGISGGRYTHESPNERPHMHPLIWCSFVGLERQIISSPPARNKEHLQTSKLGIRASTHKQSSKQKSKQPNPLKHSLQQQSKANSLNLTSQTNEALKFLAFANSSA